MKDVNGKALDPIWMAEFRGFFFGEGYLGITRNGKGRSKTSAPQFVPRAAITARDDDEAVLQDIHSKLGGLIHYDGRGKITVFEGVEHKTKPYAVWRVTSKDDVARVCDVLELGTLPSKKRHEIAIMREFLATQGVKRGRLNPKEQVAYGKIVANRQRLAEKLKEMHAYKPKPRKKQPGRL